MKLFKILIWVWQLPQHLLALLILLLIPHEKVNQIGLSKIYLLKCKKDFGISLGQYILLSHNYCYRKIMKHEYGHSIQSLLFGPIYLIVIGLPSVTLNRLTYFKILDNKIYYKLWPENWANTLGGVNK